MTRVRTFFLAEAEECLAALRSELDRDVLDVEAVYRQVRLFRGSAGVARFGALSRTAWDLETRLRELVIDSRGEGAAGARPEEGGADAQGDGLKREVRAVVESLERGVEAVREGRQREDPRMEAGMDEQTEEQDVKGPGSLEVVPVESLEYSGQEALERALSLREALEDAIVSSRPEGPILEEVFDLIRLGAK